MNTDVMFSSKTDMWETPQDFFDKLNAEFHFTLDAAASDNNAKCANYFTAADNGLRQKWEGVVWCNPPYGRKIGHWIKKALESVECGDADVVVMLLPARTDTVWFHEFVYNKAADIRFIRGRLKFGGSKNSAPFPSMVVAFGKDWWKIWKANLD